MPVFIDEIRGYEEQIARPVVMGVVRQLAERMHIPKDVTVRYVGNGSSLAVINSTLDGKEQNNRLPGDTRIILTVSETYDEDRALSMSIYKPEHPLIFKDDHLDVYLWPLKNRVKYSVSITYIASDRASALTWYTNIKRKYSQGVTEYLHDVQYSYPIPHDHIYRLGEIYRLRQNVSPIDEVVGAYLKRCFSENMTVISNQIGNNHEFVIKEKQIRILGYCDFGATPPLPEKEGDTGNYAISFNYNFDYDRVESVVMAYPYMIHNQMVPELLRPPITFYGTEDVPVNLSVSETLFKHYGLDERTLKTIQTIPGLPIPIFDDWLPGYKHEHMSNLMRIMLSVDMDNKKAIVDLNNLGEWGLDPTVLGFIKTNPITHVTPYDSVINISLYKRHSLCDFSELILTSNGLLNCVKDLDETERYHLCINLVTRIESLSQTALLALCQNPMFTIIYLLTLYPSIAQVASEYYLLPNGQTIFLGDPSTRPSCMFVGEYRIATIKLPDGDYIQSHLIPCLTVDENGMPLGFFTPGQLNTLFKKLINQEPLLQRGQEYVNKNMRLVNTFVIRAGVK